MKPLGSLAQSARGKELKSARGILIVIGILTIAVNVYMFFNAENEVQAELAKAGAGAAVQPGLKETVLALVRLIYGGTALLGMAFVVCGLLVTKFPVPATLIALVLYLGGAAVFALLNPAALASGLIIKIIIIVALVKAVQAAFAYQKETRLAQEMPSHEPVG
jgi:hypothetical protein